MQQCGLDFFCPKGIVNNRVVDNNDYYAIRKFGVEIELNNEDGLIYRCEDDIAPGMDKVARIVHNVTNEQVVISHWQFVHNNYNWIIKHDTSCGMEINTPVLCGEPGISKLACVIDALGKEYGRCDERCSLHVHVDISDYDIYDFLSFVYWYLSFEHILFDLTDSYRRNSRYCRAVSCSRLVQDNIIYSSNVDALKALGDCKYFVTNVYHLCRGGGFEQHNSRKKTIEFRFPGRLACINSVEAENWIRLFIYLVDFAKASRYVLKYKYDRIRLLISWLGLRDFFDTLGLMNTNNPYLLLLKHWIVGKLKKSYTDMYMKYCRVRSSYMDKEKFHFINALFESNDTMSLIWSYRGRICVIEEFLKLFGSLPT